MKKNYEAPIINLNKLAVADVITSSVTELADDIKKDIFF